MTLGGHMSDEPTIGEIGRAVLRVEGDVRDLRAEVKQQTATYVTRAEYAERNRAIDRETVAIREEGRTTRAELQAGFAELKAQRAPWWVLLSSGLALLSMLFLVIEKTTA